MARDYKKKEIACCDKDECAACNHGYCIALHDNDFGNRDCPFFKTREQNEAEQEYCTKRMTEKIKED